MSEINIHNYEAFYLDYLEGNLNVDDTTQLLLFLENHPELKSELEGTELIELKAKPELKFNKETLKQHIHEDNLEEYIIASIENELDEEDALELDEYLKNSPDTKALAERYKKTILIKPEINYVDKDELKKNTPVIYYLAPLVSAAAIALIILLINLDSNEKTITPVAIQQKDSNKIKTTIPEPKINKEVNIAEEQVGEIKKEKDIQIRKASLTRDGKQEQVEEKNAYDKENKIAQEETVYKKAPIKEEPLTEEIELEIAEKKDINEIEIEESPKVNELEVTNDLAENKSEKKVDVNRKTNIFSDSRRINLWKVAELGIKGFSKLNERDFDLQRNYNATGQLKSVTIKTEQRSITSPVI